MLDAIADISLVQLGLIALVAAFASIVGGVAGYGTGALMPLVLVPIVGAEPVVPIIALSSLLTNSSRAIAFLPQIDRKRTLIVLTFAIPTCVVGAYGYSLLTGKGAQIVIEEALAQEQVFRRVARNRELRKGDEVGAEVTGPPGVIEDLRGVAFEVANDGVYLGERDP